MDFSSYIILGREEITDMTVAERMQALIDDHVTGEDQATASIFSAIEVMLLSAAQSGGRKVIYTPEEGTSSTVISAVSRQLRENGLKVRRRGDALVVHLHVDSDDT